MVYCHKCGKDLKESSKYCGGCGTKRKEIPTSEHVVHHSHKRRRKTWILSILIILILIVGYLALNLWAIGQIEIDTSADSIINSISNLNVKSSLTNTELDSSLRIKNPTIIPVLISKVSYDLKYGDRTVSDGGTGFIFIMPKSYIDTPVRIEVNHIDTGVAIIEGIINIFEKDKKSLQLNFYVNFGPIKIPIGES